MRHERNHKIAWDCDNSTIYNTNNNLYKQPTYELKLAEIKQTDEEKVKQILEENKTTMYKQYAITIDNEIKTHVDTFEQAEEIVNEM